MPIPTSGSVLLMLLSLFSGETQEEAVKLKPNARRYDCPDCSEVMYLTPTETLRHKKSHL